jgi:alpha-L-rhamnosidase
LAWRIVNQRSFPSYGYMIEHGATTIWELWNGNTADPAMNSANHVMLLGDLLLWYYEDLAGIRNAEGSLGYTHLDMAPCFPEELHHVKAWQRTATGLVRSEWTRQDDSLSWQIEIPANATASIRIPQRFGIRPPEGGAVHAVKEQDDCILVEVGSGRHTFVSNSK